MNNQSGFSETRYNAERNQLPVDFYLEFASAEQKTLAANELERLRNEYYGTIQPAMPDAGPDSLFDERWGMKWQNVAAQKQDGRQEELHISFSRTPNFLNSPETLKTFLDKLLTDRGITFKKRQKGGKPVDEIYEVVDDKPQ